MKVLKKLSSPNYLVSLFLIIAAGAYFHTFAAKKIPEIDAVNILGFTKELASEWQRVSLEAGLPLNAIEKGDLYFAEENKRAFDLLIEGDVIVIDAFKGLININDFKKYKDPTKVHGWPSIRVFGVTMTSFVYARGQIGIAVDGVNQELLAALHETKGDEFKVVSKGGYIVITPLL